MSEPLVYLVNMKARVDAPLVLALQFPDIYNKHTKLEHDVIYTLDNLTKQM